MTNEKHKANNTIDPRYVDTSYKCEKCGFEISNQQPMTMHSRHDAFISLARPCVRCYADFFSGLPQMRIARGEEPDNYFRAKQETHIRKSYPIKSTALKSTVKK